MWSRAARGSRACARAWRGAGVLTGASSAPTPAARRSRCVKSPRPQMVRTSLNWVMDLVMRRGSEPRCGLVSRAASHRSVLSLSNCCCNSVRRAFVSSAPSTKAFRRVSPRASAAIVAGKSIADTRLQRLSLMLLVESGISSLRADDSLLTTPCDASPMAQRSAATPSLASSCWKTSTMEEVLAFAALAWRRCVAAQYCTARIIAKRIAALETAFLTSGYGRMMSKKRSRSRTRTRV
mmetsp:Transcript_107191/g.300094  ORF Transcript_107191/g.300094 Transcript_107191/m.300094 type:complete len:237 (+) Transcript_107191:90-800(+)